MHFNSAVLAAKTRISTVEGKTRGLSHASNKIMTPSREKIIFFFILLFYAVAWLHTVQYFALSIRRDSIVGKHLQAQRMKIIAKTENQTLSTKVHQFCVTWETDIEEWWIHNPDFEMGHENDTHYCFQRLKQEKAKLFRSIYQNQFKGNCSAVITKEMWNSGWGADISNVIDGLKFAHEKGQPFALSTSSLGWHYAAKKDGSKPVCSRRDMQCYFLNFTNCTPDYHATYPRKSFLLDRWYGFDKAREYLEYMIRPKTWLRRQIYEYLKSYQLPMPCSVLHVRRGDVVLRDPKPRRYHALDEYMNSTAVARNILLLTDDHNAIGEALYKFPDYNWVYVNRTRYRGSEGGWENHIPSDDPKLEVIVLLSILRLVRKCNTLVHSKSNLANYIYSEMKAAQETVTRVDLDQGQGNRVHNEANIKSVALSQAYM